MSASDPWFPVDAHRDFDGVFIPARYGASKLLYAMIHAPAWIDDRAFANSESSIKNRRAWAEALIKESERA